MAPELDEQRIVDVAEQAGLAISGLARRRFAPGPGGIIFGYGGIAETAIDDGVRRLAEVIAAAA